MATILNIETSTINCSVSLGINGECVVLKEYAEVNFAHAEKLHVFVQQLLEEAKVDFKCLDAIALSKGPGSYTGLRIGCSTAKGYCYALGIPMIALDTLEILARQLQVQLGTWIVPMLDARRMEVYTAAYDFQYKNVKEIQAMVLDENSWNQDQSMVFIGDGAVKFKEIYKGEGEFNLDVVLPSAAQMCQIAEEYYNDKNFEDIAYFEPFYLKEFHTTAKR